MSRQGAAMAEPIPLAELVLRIALLSPISRGVHLDGPRLHAERLVALWQADDDAVLSEAYRLLDAAAVARAIMRLAVEIEHGDPRYWTFPELEELLPALRDLAWDEILAGRLTVEAVAGVHEGRRRRIPPVQLQRLEPDWPLSRLTHAGQDEFTDVRVRRVVPRAPKRQRPPSRATMRAALKKIEAGLSPDTVPSFAELWAALRNEVGPISRQSAREALIEYAPHLRRTRGQHS